MCEAKANQASLYLKFEQKPIQTPRIGTDKVAVHLNPLVKQKMAQLKQPTADK